MRQATVKMCVAGCLLVMLVPPVKKGYLLCTWKGDPDVDFDAEEALAVDVFNPYDVPIELNFISVMDGDEPITVANIEPGGTYMMESYTGHQFSFMVPRPKAPPAYPPLPDIEPEEARFMVVPHQQTYNLAEVAEDFGARCGSTDDDDFSYGS